MRKRRGSTVEEALSVQRLEEINQRVDVATRKVKRTNLRVEVRIPDQRALLWWTNGTERLVIETRFAGQGTNFAWVVPLPSVPKVEPATRGLFPTLTQLLRPEVFRRNRPSPAARLFVTLTFCCRVAASDH